MPLSRVTAALRQRLPVLAVVGLALGVVLAVGSAEAVAATAGPFGVGLPEPAATGGGVLPGLFRAIAAWQSGFYRDLTATLRAMKADGSAGMWLAALSFLYGVLHAAGPGHGKAVISAYVLANRETARNGAVLAFVSALAQGVTAVVMVSVAAVVLGATSIAMTAAAQWLEAGSFALIVALGLWLCQRKLVQPLAAAFGERFAPVMVVAGGAPVEMRFASASAEAATCRHGHLHHGHGHRHTHGHDHSSGDVLDCGCGHVHAPAPSAIGGRLDWRKASSAILAVGFRPCTGALIVLVFALSQGLFAAGVMATFAMALGTGLTVALLTLAAVSARGLALRLAAGGDGRLAARLHDGIEAVAAVVILVFGLMMLGATLYA